MRLLVPTRMILALRKATTHPVSGIAAAKRAPKQRNKPSAAAATPKTAQSLQQLWNLSKLSDEVNSQTKLDVEDARKGVMTDVTERRLEYTVNRLSDCNDFMSIEKLLEAYDSCLQNNEKVPNARVVFEVVWAAAFAKSLGALPLSILDWIDKAMRRIPEPIPMKKEQMIWLLSIIRGDLSMLQQLQRESSSKTGRVGPEIEKETILRHVALNYLDAGKEKEFRSLWTSSDTSLLGGEDLPQDIMRARAMMHHALLRREKNGKADSAMLRWYADKLATEQRIPISQKPQFESMMVPVIRSLGGKIERWTYDDKRKNKLRKWRNDYDKSELDNLLKSMLDYMRHRIEVEKHGDRRDLIRLEVLLSRFNRDSGNGGIVVVDWLNLTGLHGNGVRLERFLPLHQLVIVGRQIMSAVDSTHRPPAENKRIKVLEVTAKSEMKQELDDVCSVILAVATRGHLISNDVVRSHVDGFRNYLESKSKDTRQSILLKNYLNDAVLRHKDRTMHIQPLVNFSKAAQWIDEDKNELAFTVARKLKDDDTILFRVIDHYSLHIK